MTLSDELSIVLWRHRLVNTGSLIGGMALSYGMFPIGARLVTFGGVYARREASPCASSALLL